MRNLFVIAAATVMLSACGSGGGGGGSAATPTTANNFGFNGGLAVSTNQIGQVPVNTWTGFFPLNNGGNPQAINARYSQFPAGQFNSLQVTISTVPTASCPTAAPGSLPGPVYFSVTTYGSTGITTCGAGFLNNQGGFSINYPATIGNGQIPTLQINTLRGDGMNLRAQILMNGQPYASGILRGSGFGGGFNRGGAGIGYPQGYQSIGYPGAGAVGGGGVFNPAFAAATGRGYY